MFYKSWSLLPVKRTDCLPNIHSLKRIATSVHNINTRITVRWQLILPGRDNGKSDRDGSIGCWDIVPNSESVVESYVHQLKGEGTGVTGVARPSKRGWSSRSEITGNGAEGDGRDQWEEENEAGQREISQEGVFR